MSPVEATAVGAWTRTFHDDGLTFCRGLRSTYRALRALDRVAGAEVQPVRAVTSEGVGERPALLESDVGPIATFADAMARLESAGAPVAPYVVVPPHATAPFAETHSLGERLVVKLADVPHRTELSAVRVGVGADDLATTIDELRGIARAHGVPETVAVQAMIAGIGEAFVGVQSHTDLGPILLFGLGGVLVEVTGQVDGALLPLAPGDAERLVERVAGEAAFARLRGQRQWAPAPLVEAIEAVAALWEAERHWLASADLNPLVVTDDGVVAVDALLVGE